MREYLKTNQSNALKAMLRNFAFSITQKMKSGMLFAIGFFGTTILAVAISGTITSWTTGQVLKSSDLNTTITSLKTAIEGIPNWTKAANGNDAYYTAGNVGIGTTSPISDGTVSRNQLSFGGFGAIWVNNDSSNPFGIDTVSAKLRIFAGAVSNTYQVQVGNMATGNNFTPYLTIGDGISNRGNVGIGTTSPSQLLTVNGNAGNTTGVWVNNSDERLKKNIQPLGNFLEKLTELRPVTFEWKDHKKLNAKEGKHIGFIAQEVEKVFPYWVDTDKDGMKWLSMEGVNAAFVQSFKEVALRLRSGNDRISVVSDSVSVVTQKIESLEKEKAANEKKLLALEEDNKRLREDMARLRGTFEERLRAIENLQMARK